MRDICCFQKKECSLLNESCKQDILDGQLRVVGNMSVMVHEDVVHLSISKREGMMKEVRMLDSLKRINVYPVETQFKDTSEYTNSLDFYFRIPVEQFKFLMNATTVNQYPQLAYTDNRIETF